MRTLLTIAAAVVASISLYSCGDDCPEPVEPETPILFRVNPNGLAFGYNDTDSQPIFVTTMNVTWKAEVEASAQDWLTINQEADKISVRVTENNTEQVRTATITITPDNETLSPVMVTVTQTLSETLRIPAHMAIWAFRGDPYDSGYASYLFTLAGGDGEYDPVDKIINMTEGYSVILDVMSDDITHEDYHSIDVKLGTYTESMDPMDLPFVFEKWSFIRTAHRSGHGYTEYAGSWIIEFANGTYADNIELSSGRVLVEGEPGNYHVVADLITNRKERVVFEYTGPFDDIRNLAYNSNINEDVEIDGLNTGELRYYGEPTTTPGTYSWTVYLRTPTRFPGKSLELWMFSPQTNPGVLDSGVYTVQKSSFSEFMVQAGYVYQGIDLGTWYYEYDNMVNIVHISPMVEGTVTVVHNGGDNYTFTADLYTDNYYKLKASFEGDLKYMDRTSTGFKGVPFRRDDDREPIPGLDLNNRDNFYGLIKLN